MDCQRITILTYPLRTFAGRGEQQPYSDWYTPGGGDNVAKYRIDKSKRRIVFEGPMMGKEIILEYISTGIPVSGNLYIPRGLMPVLKNYLDWILKKRNDQMPESKVYSAKQDFYESLHAYERAEDSMTADEILDIIRLWLHNGS